MSLVAINTVMMAQTARPRLVVGISVDQLRTDYVDYLKSLFGEKGFRLLMQNGVYLRNIDFRQTSSDAPTGTAVIATGAWPSANGVTSALRYNVEAGRTLPIFVEDGKTTYTSASYTAHPLRLSNIADEIMIDASGIAGIYSIAADPQTAIAMAGHASKNAAWIDNNTGRWVTSSYYPEFAPALSHINQFNPLLSRLDTLQWKPLLKLTEYPGVPPQKKLYPFRYTFPRNDRESINRFKASAPSNAVVTDAAIEILKSQNLGRRSEGIDMLNIGLTAAPFKYVKDGDYRLELEDTYIRLDRQIARLIEEIERSVGLDNTLIYLTSTGYYDDSCTDDAKYRIPGGDFSLKRAESLLNSFLSAKYGNGDYVRSIHGTHIYLDHSLIERKALAADKILTDARDFLMKMSGITDVYTYADIASGGESTSHLRLRTDAATCGDLIIEFAPGWQITDDISFPSTQHIVRAGSMAAPGFILYPPTGAQTINTPVDATAIAPTITSILRIRSPNGASTLPLTFGE